MSKKGKTQPFALTAMREHEIHCLRLELKAIENRPTSIPEFLNLNVRASSKGRAIELAVDAHNTETIEHFSAKAETFLTSSGKVFWRCQAFSTYCLAKASSISSPIVDACDDLSVAEATFLARQIALFVRAVTGDILLQSMTCEDCLRMYTKALAKAFGRKNWASVDVCALFVNTPLGRHALPEATKACRKALKEIQES